MDLSPPKFWIRDTPLAFWWAMSKENVRSWKYDRVYATWTVQTGKGFFSYGKLRHALVWAWRASQEEKKMVAERLRRTFGLQPR